MSVTKHQFTRQGDALVPVDHWSREKLHNYPEGQIVNITITGAKRIGALNKYWAGLGVLLENLDEDSLRQWPTVRHVHNMLMEELGFTTRIYRIDGTWRVVPDSIAIDNMDDVAFADLFERARQFMIQALDYDPWSVWEEQADIKKLERDWKRNYRPGVD